ncbi:MAG: IS110 family transposase [Candidatus Marinimicrobia bacterium]|nr:IS110 family transposase [Candidatus Neomarinimicrobiota bacterium]
MQKVKIKDWSGQSLYIGIDLHKRKWVVTVLTCELELKTFTTPADKQVLLTTLKKGWLGARMKAVYEAGCFGYHLADFLDQHGIATIIVSPHKVPVEPGQFVKTDKIDSRKLAWELSKGGLMGIYRPEKEALLDRELIRKRKQIVKRKVQVQLRIHSTLLFHGVELIFPLSGKWSKSFVRQLKTVSLHHEGYDWTYQILVEDYERVNDQVQGINNLIVVLSRTERYRNLVTLLKTVPGVGTLTAMILILEIMDMARFRNCDCFASFLGLTPSEQSSGERVRIGSLTGMGNSYLRKMLVEAAWVAVRKDPALLEKFNRLRKGKGKTKAIIAVTKSLANRIRRVWLYEEPYAIGVIG